MAISDDDRYELHQALIESIGRKQAASLMASIPPTGWADVATKHDLDALRAATKQDIDALRVVTKQRIDALEVRLEARISSSEDRLRAEMAELRAEMAEVRTEMAGVRVEVADRLRTQMQAMIVSLVGFAGVVITAVRI